MTMKTEPPPINSSAPDLANDPAWQAALDWHLRLHAQPDDTALQAAFSTWHSAHPAHARAWQRAQRVWQLSGALAPSPRQPIPIVQPSLPPRSRPTRRHKRLLGGAVAMAACLLVVLLQWPTWQADYYSPKGERRTLSLNDGSQLTLDGGSAIKVHLDKTQRQITLLQGRVYFQVSRDAARPFQVMAGTTTITVTGTAFTVDHGDERSSVAVEHGSVQVDDSQTDTRQSKTALGAGDRLELDHHQGKAQLSHQAPGTMAAWRKGLLVADNQPLAQVLEQLAKQLPGLVVLHDQALGQRRVTGVFDLTRPEAALEALITPQGGRIEAYSPWLLVIQSASEKNK
ncbi:MAG: FecR family protein [Gammaproteobacteria bacterium]|nr:FecR family protein [Gammaproteobacteria bacterium]MBU1491039.1 FecR family protein [Gammaproteobacteria bacterium]MBU2065698.1 FecR family protein [Gammaproteobacteria bacterium]MBU2139044.1 FecR family protein [Gammaproteobacteria bacterium]MBU2217631.1 FecR family protein [Gammaproteobacteria bacterium]